MTQVMISVNRDDDPLQKASILFHQPVNVSEIAHPALIICFSQHIDYKHRNWLIKPQANGLLILQAGLKKCWIEPFSQNIIGQRNGQFNSDAAMTIKAII